MTLTKAMKHGNTLLIPEIVVSPFLSEMQDYFDMLKDISDKEDNVFFFDPLYPNEQGDMHLADRNHLTREGNRWLGEKNCRLHQ